MARPLISLAIGGFFHYMPRNIRVDAHVHRPSLDDIPAKGDPFPADQKGKTRCRSPQNANRN
jgi:hypothetical protein